MVVSVLTIGTHVQNLIQNIGSAPSGDVALVGDASGGSDATLTRAVIISMSGSSGGHAGAVLTPLSAAGMYQAIARSCRIAFYTRIELPEGLPTAYDNQTTIHRGDGLFAEVSVDFDDTTQERVSADPVRFRTQGRITARLSVPIEVGDGSLWAMADLIKTAFRQRDAGPVTFLDPVDLPVGRIDDYWAHDVIIEFWSDSEQTLASGFDLPLSGDWADVAAVCRGRFRERVEIPYSVPVQYDNAPAQDFAISGAPWVSLNILTGDTVATTTNPGSYKTLGLVVASVYVPMETGDNACYTLVDRIADQFRAVTDHGVTFRTPSVTVIGREGHWWRIDVRCPFYNYQME